MAKLSFIKFDVYSWINDTRSLSAEAKGCWIDILCLMWNAPKRGVWEGTYQEFSRVTGTPWESAPTLINELVKVANLTKSNNNITLENRRMVREQKAHESNAKRQMDHYHKHKPNANLTDKTLDVRHYKEKYIKRKFVKPTAEELTAYGGSIGYTLDPQKFLDHYEANGWKVGKTAMVDWQAAVRTWKRNGNGFESQAVSPKAAVLPRYKESVPPAEEVMSADDIAGIRASLGR